MNKKLGANLPSLQDIWQHSLARNMAGRANIHTYLLECQSYERASNPSTHPRAAEELMYFIEAISLVWVDVLHSSLSVDARWYTLDGFRCLSFRKVWCVGMCLSAWCVGMPKDHRTNMPTFFGYTADTVIRNPNAHVSNPCSLQSE